MDALQNSRWCWKGLYEDTRDDGVAAQWRSEGGRDVKIEGVVRTFVQNNSRLDRNSLGLPFKSRAPVGVVGNIRPQNLQRHVAPQPSIARAVNLPLSRPRPGATRFHTAQAVFLEREA